MLDSMCAKAHSLGVQKWLQKFLIKILVVAGCLVLVDRLEKFLNKYMCVGFFFFNEKSNSDSEYSFLQQNWLQWMIGKFFKNLQDFLMSSVTRDVA